jgi:hypothetical protein
MKIMVILVVLFAGLLTGAAFATDPCLSCSPAECFTVSGTNLDNSNNSFTAQWYICSDNYPNLNLCDSGIEITPLVMFDQGLNPQAVSYSFNNGVYITFHGGDFNGLFYNVTNTTKDRYKIHGVRHGCG